MNTLPNFSFDFSVIDIYVYSKILEVEQYTSKLKNSLKDHLCRDHQGYKRILIASKSVLKEAVVAQLA